MAFETPFATRELKKRMNCVGILFLEILKVEIDWKFYQN